MCGCFLCTLTHSRTHTHTHTLTDDTVEHRIRGVLRGNLVVPIDDPQFARVLKWVGPETQGEEEAAQCPDVSLLVDRVVTVQVYHLRGAIHGRGVTLDLKGGVGVHRYIQYFILGINSYFLLMET